MGDSVDEIFRYAGSHNANPIVCGTRRGWSHLMMGGVAERTVRLGACPVLTVHAPETIAAAA
jgi:nucleotide-binding universal stress UspA family protein